MGEPRPDSAAEDDANLEDVRPPVFRGKVDGRRGSVGRGTLEFVAGPEVERIGLAFSTMPPEQLVIKRVTAGTWADTKGIEAGDVFEAVNGRSTNELDAAEFKKLMQQRPLSMRIASLSDDEEDEDEDEDDEDEDAVTAGRVTVFDTDIECRSAKLDKVLATPVAAKPEVDPEIPSTCRVAFVVEGSRGDCQASLALAVGFKGKGYTVKVFTSMNHVAFAQDLGLDACSCLHFDVEECLRSSEIKELMASGKGESAIAMLVENRHKYLLEDAVKTFISLDEYGPSLLLFGPLTSILSLCYSAKHDVPAMEALPFGANHELWKVQKTLNKLAIEAHIAIVSEAVATDLSLRVSAALFVDYVSERRNVQAPGICGVSTSVVCVRPDWAIENLNFSGFWVMDPDRQDELMRDPVKALHFGGSQNKIDLSNFLNSCEGSPPIYFGWGSMIANSETFMVTLAVETLVRTERRGILCGDWTGLGAASIEDADLREYCNEFVIFVKSAPQEWLFPQCAAIVHHGDVATTSASLHSGQPTIITPCIGDQHDFAKCVNRLGVGVGLPELRTLKANDVVRAVRTCLKVQDAAQRFAEELRAEDGVKVAAEFFSQWLKEEYVTGNWANKFMEIRKRVVEERRKQNTRASCTCQ